MSSSINASLFTVDTRFDFSRADYLMANYHFIFWAHLFGNWTQMTPDEEEKTTLFFLNLVWINHETAPVQYAMLLFVSITDIHMKIVFHASQLQ